MGQEIKNCKRRLCHKRPMRRFLVSSLTIQVNQSASWVTERANSDKVSLLSGKTSHGRLLSRKPANPYKQVWHYHGGGGGFLSKFRVRVCGPQFQNGTVG